MVVLEGAVAQQITHLTAHVCSHGCGFGLSTSDNRTYIYIIFQSALIKRFFTFRLKLFTDLNCLMFSGCLCHLACSGYKHFTLIDEKTSLSLSVRGAYIATTVPYLNIWCLQYFPLVQRRQRNRHTKKKDMPIYIYINIIYIHVYRKICMKVIKSL